MRVRAFPLMVKSNLLPTVTCIWDQDHRQVSTISTCIDNPQQRTLSALSQRRINPMTEQQNNESLHGITLEKILNSLVEYYDWSQLGQLIDIRCFNNDPSIKSSLKFLRKTPWARKRVEDLYLAMDKSEC